MSDNVAIFMRKEMKKETLTQREEIVCSSFVNCYDRKLANVFRKWKTNENNIDIRKICCQILRKLPENSETE